MGFWLREAAGWLLVGLGLFTFYWGYHKMTSAEPGAFLIQAGPVFFAGFVIFRGGIHLLKVAVAARICLRAQADARPPSAEPRTPRSRAVGRA